MQSYNCPNYLPYLKEHLSSIKDKKRIAENQKSYSYISKHTGKSPFGLREAFALYYIFRDQV